MALGCMVGGGTSESWGWRRTRRKASGQREPQWLLIIWGPSGWGRDHLGAASKDRLIILVWRSSVHLTQQVFLHQPNPAHLNSMPQDLSTWCCLSAAELSWVPWQLPLLRYHLFTHCNLNSLSLENSLSSFKNKQ